MTDITFTDEEAAAMAAAMTARYENIAEVREETGDEEFDQADEDEASALMFMVTDLDLDPAANLDHLVEAIDNALDTPDAFGLDASVLRSTAAKLAAIITNTNTGDNTMTITEPTITNEASAITYEVMTSLAVAFGGREESATKMAQRERDMLARVAADGQVNDLVGIVNSLAKSEGAAQVWARLDRAARWHAERASRSERFSRPAALAELLDLANSFAAQADDTWSGRGNDGRRAFHDGQVEAMTAASSLITEAVASLW